MARRLSVLVAALVFSTFAGQWTASPALASFPGANGKIVYSASPVAAWPSSIWVVASGGGAPSQLTVGTVGQGDNSPAWSPGGTMIAFSRDATGSTTDTADDIFVMLANGTGVKRLTNNPADDLHPNWSPDGARLVFSSNRAGNYEIYSMKIDGSDLKRLTNNAADDGQPNWSPDGTKIVFRSDRSGNFEIYSMKADGTGVARLTTSAGNDLQPNWSPDGNKIAFSSNRTGWYEIFVMNANGGAPTQLTNLFTSVGRPSWSPDGSVIVFEGLNPYDFDVLTMDATGAGVGWIVSTADDDWNPDWQPIPAFPLVDARFSAFHGDIVWLFNSGITSGCSAERFCSDDAVTRGQMAAFLARAMHLPAATADYFSDDETSIFEPDINRLAEAGITSGCGGGKYCPESTITREQMAAYLDRALHPPSTLNDYFTDDEASIFEANINRVAAAGITKGCSLTTYCPLVTVTRGQMAAFLHRAFGP